MLLGEPPQTPYDLHFSLFGIPVRVHPFFWVIAILLGFSAGELINLLVWVVAMFLAILVHELGHALMMRRYGHYPHIVLYGMGGLTSSGPAQVYGSAANSTQARILISAAGPGAGFLLAALIVAGLALAGPGVQPIFLNDVVPFIMPAGMVGSYALTVFIWDVLFISIFWGVMNLLPVLPLDGGHIAQKILVALNPVDGIRQSLLLSMVTAIAVAVIGSALMREWFIAIMFGFLAYFSYRALQFYQGPGRWS